MMARPVQPHNISGAPSYLELGMMVLTGTLHVVMEVLLVAWNAQPITF